MEPHQERVVAEKTELDKKLVGLSSFIPTQIFLRLDVAEQSRLKRQMVAMQDYSVVLGERIAAF